METHIDLNQDINHFNVTNKNVLEFIYPRKIFSISSYHIQTYSKVTWETSFSFLKYHSNKPDPDAVFIHFANATSF